jgi:hypothetical protein
MLKLWALHKLGSIKLLLPLTSAYLLTVTWVTVTWLTYLKMIRYGGRALLIQRALPATVFKVGGGGPLLHFAAFTICRAFSLRTG